MPSEKRCSDCGEVKPIRSFPYQDSAGRYRRTWCNECYGLRRILRVFKLSVAEYRQMEQEHRGVCAICGNPETRTRHGKPLRLCVDHNEETGQIRGLLCYKCNLAIGLLDHDPDVVAQAVAYLTKYVEGG